VPWSVQPVAAASWTGFTSACGFGRSSRWLLRLPRRQTTIHALVGSGRTSIAAGSLCSARLPTRGVLSGTVSEVSPDAACRNYSVMCDKRPHVCSTPRQLRRSCERYGIRLDYRPSYRIAVPRSTGATQNTVHLHGLRLSARPMPLLCSMVTRDG
jgi:hypothetical protein